MVEGVGCSVLAGIGVVAGMRRDLVPTPLGRMPETTSLGQVQACSWGKLKGLDFLEIAVALEVRWGLSFCESLSTFLLPSPK